MNDATRVYLQTYLRILRLHRTRLPGDMRKLGDSYVKKEFRDHRKAKPEFVRQFLSQWSQYADMLAMKKKEEKFGKDLDKDTISKLSDEQKLNLENLRKETSVSSSNNINSAKPIKSGYKSSNLFQSYKTKS